jgi:hypothetical protein
VREKIMSKENAVAGEACFSCGTEAAQHKWIGRGSATLGLSKRLAGGEDPMVVAADMAQAGSRMENYPICDECHQNPKPGLKLHYFEAGAASESADGALGMPTGPNTTRA